MFSKHRILRILQISMIGHQSLAGKIYSLKVITRSRLPSVPWRTIVGVRHPYLPQFTLSVPRRITLIDRPAQPLILSEPRFLTFLKFILSVYRRTLMRDRCPFDGPSCITVATIRIFVPNVLKNKSKCSSMDPQTDCRAYNGPSMGLSCTLSFYIVILFLCFPASSSTNYFSLHVQMSPKQDRDYS